MEYLHIILMAIVQGLTEFLPVSSKGHLTIVDALLSDGELNDSGLHLALVVMLHVGTLVALLIVYWQRIWRLLGTDRSLALKLIVGTVPGATMGAIIKKTYPELESQVLLTGIMFLVTGALLFRSQWHLNGTTAYEQVTYRQALLIGCAQAACVLPGYRAAAPRLWLA